MMPNTMIRTLSRLLMTVAILLALLPRAFAETRTILWDPVTAYTDGMLIEAGKTVSYSAYWTTDPGLGSLRTIGTSLPTTSTTFDPDVQGMTRGGTVYFSVKGVLNTGEASDLSSAYAWVVPLVSPPPAVLSSIAVSGPSSVSEGGAGTYTATGTWDDGTTAAVTPTWSENSSYATISTGGLLTASTVTSNQTVTVTASYGGKTATKSMTIVDVPTGLSSIAVSGPSSVNEGGTGTYTATGMWDNGTTMEVTPTWSENSSYATISNGGLLTASTVTSNQTVTLTASYGGKTTTKSATIVDVPGAAPAAPRNVDIIGPTSTVPTQIWRLSWDPVTTNWDGAPLDPGRTVRYTVYWTDDPALSAASLRQLASSISGTTLDFVPSSNQMAKNQVVYLTVRAILDAGDPSSLAPSLTWRVENTGPVPPGHGRIIKK